MKKLVWLFNRLKSMSCKEIAYRIKKLLYNKKNKIKYSKDICVKDILKRDIEFKNLDSILSNIWNYDIEVNINNNFEYEVFNDKINFLNKIDWHKCSNGNWEKNKYSLDIDCKFTDDIGDIRYTWEINRHQFLPYIAIAYKNTKNDIYYNIIKKHFYDWNKENFFLKGVNWSSPMEISLRSYQWLIVYYFIKDSKDEIFKKDIIKLIISSMDYVSKNLSSYSSANNHLILEAFILSEIGYILNDSYKQNWFEIGYSILNKEIPLQFYNDGVNKEQAQHYQAFVTDAMLQYNFFLRKINKKTIHDEIIKKSLVFLGSLYTENFNFDFGDSDDAKIINISLENINYYKYVLQLGSIYYNTKFIEISNIYKEVSFITGIYKMDIRNDYLYKKLNNFTEAGYFLIRDNKSILLFDCANLGFKEIAAHGHADALALIFYYNGNPLFIDSGTYIYNVESELRDYFRATIAHNTLVYNNRNQSEIKGPFLWGKKAKSNVEYFSESNSKVCIVANHDGYKPIIHRRRLEYDFNNFELKIRDYFEDNAVVTFILDNNVRVTKISDNIIQLNLGSDNLKLKSNSKMLIEDCIISKEFMKQIKTKKILISSDFSDNDFIETILIKNE
ncbi:alginate lyase family protein [Clostridium perfringens]